ncbi:hypothetical protein B0H13DRAFT_1932539 [Mycena leptocephala]|nr:hypothetical protein B0H13DRAFT_1932539 [Mycena leptocephala]
MVILKAVCITVTLLDTSSSPPTMMSGLAWCRNRGNNSSLSPNPHHVHSTSRPLTLERIGIVAGDGCFLQLPNTPPFEHFVCRTLSINISKMWPQHIQKTSETKHLANALTLFVIACFNGPTQWELLELATTTTQHVLELATNSYSGVAVLATLESEGTS